MATARENALILLSLVIIYLGIYTLRTGEVKPAQSNDAQWAGIFAITLGVFTLISLILAEEGFSLAKVSQRSLNLPSLVAGVALLVSAFFYIKLLRSGLEGNTFKIVVWAQIIAHVLLLIAFFTNWDRFEMGSTLLPRTPRGSVVAPAPVFTSPTFFAQNGTRIPQSTRV